MRSFVIFDRTPTTLDNQCEIGSIWIYDPVWKHGVIVSPKAIYFLTHLRPNKDAIWVKYQRDSDEV